MKSNDSKITAKEIAFSLVKAIAEQRLAPGTRLGEEELGAVFQVSRTTVRQALTQLASQGIFGVRPKKGWFVIEPSDKEVKEVFAARRLVEGALVHQFAATASRLQINALREHMRSTQVAISGQDVALHAYLLADFHIQIAEMAGNDLITRTVRDFTLRTSIIAMLHKSAQETPSMAEHELILNAIERHDGGAATSLMIEHINNVEAGMCDRKSHDPVRILKETLLWNAAPAPKSSPIE